MVTYPFNFEQTKTLKEGIYVLSQHLKKTEKEHYKRNELYYRNIYLEMQRIWEIQYKEKYGEIPTKECPKCKNVTYHIEEINGYMCSKCNILIFGDKQIIPIPETEVIED